MKISKLQMKSVYGAVFALLLLVLAFPVQLWAADDYPNRPLRLIIPFPPGGGNDIIGRLIASELTPRLGKGVIVDNRGGAGGIVGTEYASKAAPDGYTLLVVGGPFTAQAALQPLPYDPIKSFSPVARLSSGPGALVVHAGLPVNNLKEFIALAKQKPGQLIFSSSGAGMNTHMAMELLKIMAGIDFKIIHYKGGGPALIDVLGGHTQAMIGSLNMMLPHLQSGKLKLLATTGLKRSETMPDVPTVAESGLPGYELNQWRGILAPANTPASAIERLNREMKVVLRSEEVKKKFLNDGAEVDYLGPADLGKYIENEINTWKKVAKESNIKLE